MLRVRALGNVHSDSLKKQSFYVLKKLINRQSPLSERCGQFVVRAVCCLLALSVSGCIVGPDYSRPAIPALEDQFVAAAALPGPGESVGIHDAWWDQFQDPHLVSLLETAVSRNQTLKLAYARVLEARTRSDLTALAPWPRLDANGSYSRRNQRNPGFLTGVSANGGSAFDALSSGLSASWEIDMFGRLRRSIESQDAQWGSAVDQLRDALVTLLADVATNYVELRVLQQRLTVARQNVDVQTRSLDIAKQRYAAGLVGALDSLQAESILKSTQATIPQLEEQLQNRVNRICILIGESPNLEMQQWLGNGVIPKPGAAIFAGIPADLVRQRPDVRAAEKTMHSACAEIGVATAELYPRVNLVGDLGYDSLSLSDLFANQAFFSIGPSVRWNLITLGRTRRAINIREAQHLAAVHRFRQTVLSAVEEVENGLVGVQKRKQRDRLLRESAQAARDAYGLSLTAYEIGNSTFQRVLESQRQLLNAQDTYLRNQGDVAQSVISTYRALGAGWRTLAHATSSLAPVNDESEVLQVSFIPRPQRMPLPQMQAGMADDVLAPISEDGKSASESDDDVRADDGDQIEEASRSKLLFPTNVARGTDNDIHIETKPGVESELSLDVDADQPRTMADYSTSDNAVDAKYPAAVTMGEMAVDADSAETRKLETEETPPAGLMSDYADDGLSAYEAWRRDMGYGADQPMNSDAGTTLKDQPVPNASKPGHSSPTRHSPVSDDEMPSALLPNLPPVGLQASSVSSMRKDPPTSGVRRKDSMRTTSLRRTVAAPKPISAFAETLIGEQPLSREVPSSLIPKSPSLGAEKSVPMKSVPMKSVPAAIGSYASDVEAR